MYTYMYIERRSQSRYVARNGYVCDLKGSRAYVRRLGVLCRVAFPVTMRNLPYCTVTVLDLCLVSPLKTFN